MTAAFALLELAEWETLLTQRDSPRKLVRDLTAKPDIL